MAKITKGMKKSFYLMKARQVLAIGVFFITCLFMLGCMAALVATALAPSAIWVSGEAYNAIEKADINAAVSPGVTKEELNKIKHIALIFGTEGPQRVGTWGGTDITSLVGDNLAAELMKLGFRVSGRQKLELAASEQQLQVSELANVKNAIEAGKILGADAIVTGNVVGAMRSRFSIFGGGKIATVVQNASLQIIGVERGDTLMAVTIDYKKGQGPKVAAESMAAILKAKLEEPFIDVKRSLKKGKE